MPKRFHNQNMTEALRTEVVVSVTEVPFLGVQSVEI
jgi:hypothetical protein